MIRIAIDDTDSALGGCTTYLALEVISRLHEWVPYGYPRLVRLNPNIPWKTRGNGAIMIRLLNSRSLDTAAGTDREKLVKRQIGAIGPDPVFGYFQEGADRTSGIPDLPAGSPGTDPGGNLDDLLETVSSVVEEHSRLDDPKTNSGVVVGTTTPGEELYWHAVREVVELHHVEKILDAGGFYYRGWKNMRGLIGAAAALGWDPTGAAPRKGPIRTYELISYRERSMWGTERRWEWDSAKDLDAGVPGTFDNYDHINGLPRIAPHTPCPVLFGVRCMGAEGLPGALDIVRTHEPVDRWVIFETNHATDDHLQTANFGGFSEHRSIILEGTVSGLPWTMKGGHTFVEMSEEAEAEERIFCAAYEPTKGFREYVRGLRMGDRIVAYGGLRSGPEGGFDHTKPTLNLEKLEVISTVMNLEKVFNPRCPTCGKGMKSIGKDQGYRCKKCGIHIDEEAVELIPEKRALKPGFYEVPVCARRHLSTPLSMIANNDNRVEG